MRSARGLLSSSAVCVIVLCGASAARAQFISASPQTLSFVYQIGGPNPAAQNILLSADAPSSFAVTISGAPWLSVSPASGITPSTLVVTVTPPAGVTPGTLSGTILIGPPASADSLRTVVSVTLQILAPPQGNLIVNPSGLAFNYTFGGPIPPPQGIAVTSTGAAASFTVTTNASWLYAPALSYVTPASVQVSIYPGPSLLPGVYNGTVFINPTYGGGTQQTVTVTLRVSAAGTLSAAPTFLSFSYQTGGAFPVPQTVNVINSTGSNTTFTASVSTSNGGNWLSCSPVNATTPAAIIISANPANLGAGTYTGTVTFTASNAAASPTQIPVSLAVYGFSQLVLDPSSLSFNYQAGGPAPATQYAGVTSTGGAINYALRIEGLSWVSTTATGGTTPSGFGVVVSPPAGLAPGTYTANVSVTPNSGGGTAVTLPVSVSVSGANYITVGRNAVSFDYTPGGSSNPPPALVAVTSSSGPLRFEAAAATLGFGTWLSVSQSSQYTPANLTISVSPQGLAAGTYTGTVVINSEDASNGQQQIEVTLKVTSTSLNASPFGLVFSYQVSDGSAPPQLLVVSSQGGAVPFTINTTTHSGGSWLLAVGSGTTPMTISAAVNGTALAPGTYTGEIQIKPNDPTTPALSVPVVLNVSAAPVFQPSVNQLSFQYEIGAPAPASQQVTIDTNTGGSVFYTSAFTADGGNWLSVQPSVASTPFALAVSVNPTGLTAGTYYGLIGVNSPAGDVPLSFVPVTFQVASGPILSVASPPLVFSTQTGIGNLAPQQITINGPGVPTSFHVTTYGGTWLSASPTDGMTNGQVNVAVNASGLAPGYYLGLVEIDIPGIDDIPQYVPVALVIAPGFSQ